MTVPGGEHRKITVVDATHLAAPVTELEEARAHLRVCQDHLEHCRNNIGIQTHQDQRDIWRTLAKAAEAHIFAALSWVWDAQERFDTRAIIREVEESNMPDHSITILALLEQDKDDLRRRTKAYQAMMSAFRASNSI